MTKIADLDGILEPMPLYVNGAGVYMRSHRANW